MKRKIAFCLAIFSIAGILNAQDNQAQKKEDQQTGAAILDTEKGLDQRASALNERLKRHTVLMKMKVRILPFRTVLFKGKANNDECVPANSNAQEDAANNCIRVEVYDFIKDEERGQGKIVQGGLSKYMEIYFEGPNTNDPDPRMEPPRKISKIISKVYKNNFLIEDKSVSEIIDRAPNDQPGHNDKIELFYQKNGYPEGGRPETPSEKGVGKYVLANVENTKTHPIRNSFKKTFYIKHLDSFDRLFTKIFDYNDQLGNENYKENVNTLKESLKY
ncbi:hypothetical protein EHQ81_16930 [Leptospira selangorensis]|uniref:SH3 domain-containing protein n=1 Tax=Leptospira selangorensis TaxID=2484982 RepID=A0A5F2C4I7_9LEPT|nr:hypothetical protein [Leptospira selangorensis]TGM11362.1 hypothetical protein EHQ81_16930 [Leptospira selangorensis]TGM21011.1 hypothetical protein EHQ82_08315 [Leptospira selangorensis]